MVPKTMKRTCLLVFPGCSQEFPGEDLACSKEFVMADLGQGQPISEVITFYFLLFQILETYGCKNHNFVSEKHRKTKYFVKSNLIYLENLIFSVPISGMGMGGDPRLEMRNDPRMMMHGDPRMGHGGPRMMFGCRPRRWMFRHMMQNAASSEDENTVSEGEEHQGTTTTKARGEKMREQRKEFSKMAREMGWFPRRWGFPQSDSDAEKSDDAGKRDPVQQEAVKLSREEVCERHEKMREEMRGKRQRFCELVRETGVYPWMFKALAQELYGSKKSDDATESAENPQEEEMMDEEPKKMTENKEKFL